MARDTSPIRISTEIKHWLELIKEFHDLPSVNAAMEHAIRRAYPAIADAAERVRKIDAERAEILRELLGDESELE